MAVTRATAERLEDDYMPKGQAVRTGSVESHFFSMDINTKLVTQINAADSPALPTNRRALFMLTARTHVCTDHTCTHDTRRTRGEDSRARPLGGSGPGLPTLSGTLHRRLHCGPCASRAPSAPCPPFGRPPARRASCSALRKGSPYRCRCAAAARRCAARAPAAIHSVEGAVLHAWAQEIPPGTVS